MPSDRFRPRGDRLFVLLALLLLAGCSTRKHSNPFDPRNPDTGGRPRLLSAVAGDGRVDLSWELEEVEGVLSYRLRRVGPEGQQVLAESLEAYVRGWVDTTVVNETPYEYQLDVRLAGRPEAVETPPVPATPGRRAIWLLEGREGGPVQVSPDGRHLVARRGEWAPARLDVDARTGSAYVADASAERVESYSSAGVRLASRRIDGVVAVTPLPGAAGVWLAATDPGRLLRLSADLVTTVSVDTVEGQFQELAWDDARGALWASDVAGFTVLHRRNDGRKTVIEGFGLPVSLAIDPLTGDAWVADRRRGTVSRIDAAADTLIFRVSGFRAPLDLVVDPGGSGVWVSDGTLGIVVHLDATGVEVGRISGFDRPYGLAGDPEGVALWITDPQRGTLERYGLSGSLEMRLGGFYSPFSVAVALPPPPGARKTP